MDFPGSAAAGSSIVYLPKKKIDDRFFCADQSFEHKQY